MTFIIVGASAGLGRSLAEKFASESNDLVIISSDIQDLDALKCDIQNRFDVRVYPIQINFNQYEINFEELDKVMKNIKKVKGILLPIGLSDPSDNPHVDGKKINEIFNINLVNVCIFINHMLKILKDTKYTITGFGSISATRGRSRNSTYAAAKRGLDSYFESLRHSESQRVIQFYILGYLHTNLTFAEPIIGFKPVNVNKLSTYIYKNISKDFGKKIFPTYWKPIIIILKILPWVLFKKIKF